MKHIYFLFFSLSIASFSFAQEQQRNQLYYKTVVEYLASDELSGRLTGLPGELNAAKFIRREMVSNGLKSVDSNNYFQNFEYSYLRIPTPNNHLHIGYKDTAILPKFGVDFVLLSASSSVENKGGISAPAYIAGYGLVDKKSNYSDYKSYTKQDSGKIFIIKLGFPKTNEGADLQSISSIQKKMEFAKEKGAAGIIFVNPDGVSNVPTGQLKGVGYRANIPVVFYKKDIGNVKDIVDVGMVTAIAEIKKTGHNVIGAHIRNPKKKFIVIAAHHDHLGNAELGGSKVEGQEVHNGADNNASGVAMLLSLAKRLPKHRDFKKYNLLFVSFSGTEIGHIGSKHFINNCPIDTQKILAMINLDKVGRLSSLDHNIEINGVGTSPYWKKRIKRIKVDSSKLRISAVKGRIDSANHTAFYIARIPIVQITSGSQKEHLTPKDDSELINYPGMLKIEDYTIKLMCKIKRRKRRFKKEGSYELQRTLRVLN